MLDSEYVEKLALVMAKADAAHSRLDRHESITREDMKEIKKDIKDLIEYMHRSKGRDAALIFIAGFSGAGISKFLATFFGQ